jgi:hypothetical protein
MLEDFKRAVDEEAGKRLTVKQFVRCLTSPFTIKNMSRISEDCFCADPLSDGRDLKSLHCCGTVFHAGCLMEWFDRDERCPYCQHSHGNRRPRLTYEELATSMSLHGDRLPGDPMDDDDARMIGEGIGGGWVVFDPERLEAVRQQLDRENEELREEADRLAENLLEEEEDEEEEEEDPILTACHDLVEETLVGNAGVDESKEELAVMFDPLTDDGELDDSDEAVRRLRVAVAGATGRRSVFIISAYNAGVSLNDYCRINEVSRRQAVKTLRIAGLSNASASDFCRFADIINGYDRGIEFVYACRASWRAVRRFVRNIPGPDEGEADSYLATAFHRPRVAL